MKAVITKIGLVSAAALVAGGTVGLATPASAAVVSAAPNCGATVSTSITLSANIGPCSGDGLRVGADQITINLNGHTISGDGNYQNGAQAGIRITNHRLVTVKGPGTIKLFNAGVTIEGGSQDTVTGITATLNRACNTNTGTPPQVCFDNNMGDGILMVSTTGNLVQNNIVTFNATTTVASGGISMVFGSSQNQVIDNTVTDNDNTAVRVESGGGTENIIRANAILRSNGNGVSLVFGAARNHVIGNNVQNNKFLGIRASFDGNSNEIVGNSFIGNSTGISIGSAKNTIRGNSVMSNTGDGIAVTGGSVFLLDDGTVGDFVRRDNVVQSNSVQNNGGNGIVLGCAKDFVSTNPALANKCLTTTYNDGSGMPISPSTNDQVLNNGATGNGGSAAGILTRDGSGTPTGTFDLLDQNEHPPCDHNTWSGNHATKGFPACTLA